MKRILAHKIIYLDRVYPLSVATIDGGKVTDIVPFETECHTTTFISGTVKLVPRDGSVDVIRISGQRE